MPGSSRLGLALWVAVVLACSVVSVVSVVDVFPLPKYAAEQREDARRALDSIRLDDGMSQREAEIIAVVYFFNSVSGCGGPYDPRRVGDRWVFKLLVGAAGAYSGDLEIEASTGRITDDSDVVFSSLADLRKDALSASRTR